MGRISKKGKFVRNIKYAVTTKKQQAREAAARKEESDSSEPEFEEEFEDDEDDDIQPPPRPPPKSERAIRKPKVKATKKPKAKQTKEADDESSSEESDMDLEKHKEIVRSLKDKDPDFYDYLKEHDKELLDFYEEDEEDEAETTEETKKTETVTMSHINKYSQALQQKPTVRTVVDVMSLFRAAVIQAEGGEVGQTKGLETRFVVEGQVLFNAVVRLCLTELVPALHKVLNLPPPALPQDGSGKGPQLDPTRSAHWRKILVPVKCYLQDIIKLTNAITEAKLMSVLLKHVLLLVPYYVALPQIAKALHKRLVTLWCEGEETVRILAFFCLIRTVRRLPKAYLNALLKYMYMSYVRNCKFTSPTTWPLIVFMRRSLAEMYALDQAMAYQHAFLYIRQLAIHLRNAMTVKKKDTCKAVYNWQYVHCCLLWAHLLATVYPSDALEPLIYPLVQTVTGAIQLIPAAKYVPLRFHLIRGLVQLTTCTRTFIPVLPHLLEVFTIINFERKHTAVSMRPVDLRCMLRASESQMKENGFRDAVVENFYDITLEYLAGYSSSVAFPELTLPAVVRLKAWVKKCRVANYVRKVRQLLEKIEENTKFIEDRRRGVTCKLGDTAALDLLENKWKEEGTPLARFYAQWEKIRGEKQAIADDRDVVTELPESETDSEDERRKKKKGKKEKKEMKKKKEGKRREKEVKEEEIVEGDRDVVKDIVLSSSDDEQEDDDSDEMSD